VVVSYGMGVDSTALLLHWLDDGFADLGGGQTAPLSDVVVITAMTGDEWPDTSLLVEMHVLPRMAAAGVRYVQVARRGATQADGIAVLDDSRLPIRLFAAGGGWALSDELLTAGTLPQVAHGRRLCSLKWKGWPLDTWLAGELGEGPYHHVLGFNADERRRAELRALSHQWPDCGAGRQRGVPGGDPRALLRSARWLGFDRNPWRRACELRVLRDRFGRRRPRGSAERVRLCKTRPKSRRQW